MKKSKTEETTLENIYRGNKRRHAALEGIRAPHRVAAEVEDKGESDEEPEVEEKEESTSTKTEESQEEEELKNVEPVSKSEEDLVTIVVDGEERQVERDKLIEAGRRTLQKESAADRRLQEATRILREAEEREARQKNSEAELKRNTPPPVETDEEIKKTARNIIEKMMDGNDDEATEALAKVIGRREPTTQNFDPNALVSRTKYEVREELKKEQAWGRFQSEYSDLIENPGLFQIADNETLRISKEHPEYSFEEVIMEAGKRTREWLGSLTGPKSDATSKLMEERRSAKRNSGTVKGAQIRQAPKPEPKPLTRSDVVADMKQRRGQRY